MELGVIIGEAAPLAWDRWRHIVKTVESLGFHSLFRSDHYFGGVQKETIDPYLSLVIAANESDRLRFGTLVSPVTFRRPVDVGRMAQQLDALSNGRFVLGLGIGWFKAEHKIYGLDFPSVGERYPRLDEAIRLMHELWYSENGVFEGRFFQIAGTDSQPHPPHGRPPILIGGTGPTRTLGMVATYANEWNATPVSAERYQELNATLTEHCDRLGRDPAEHPSLDAALRDLRTRPGISRPRRRAATSTWCQAAIPASRSTMPPPADTRHGWEAPSSSSTTWASSATAELRKSSSRTSVTRPTTSSTGSRKTFGLISAQQGATPHERSGDSCHGRTDVGVVHGPTPQLR